MSSNDDVLDAYVYAFSGHGELALVDLVQAFHDRENEALESEMQALYPDAAHRALVEQGQRSVVLRIKKMLALAEEERTHERDSGRFEPDPAGWPVGASGYPDSGAD